MKKTIDVNVQRYSSSNKGEKPTCARNYIQKTKPSESTSILLYRPLPSWNVSTTLGWKSIGFRKTSWSNVVDC